MTVNLLSYGPKYYSMRNATAKRAKLKNITVVGVTGSVGKTSTKHFIKQLYPEAIVSKQHRNSAYMIAQDIEEQLMSDVKLYIAEMGAYVKGEIKQLTQIAQPKIGVITAIRNQHVALFGSIEKLAQAKWELITGLPKNGIAILNADDQMIQQMAQKYAKTLPDTVLWYSTKANADVYATEIQVLPKTIKATIHVKDFSQSVEIPLLGGVMLSNILAAVTVLHAYGISPETIMSNLSNLQPFKQTMELRSGKNNVTVIDDSYSASEDSVIEAINHVNLFASKDIRIILVPIIELGDSGEAIHKRINDVLEQTAAKIYLYGQAYRSVLQPKNGEWYNDPQKLIKAVTKDITQDTVILIEGRVPDIVRQAIITP